MARILSARPNSVTGLLLVSFGLIALPLVIAVGFGVVYVDRLTDQSQRLVIQGVTVTRNSRRLLDIITDMERSARQYAVLGSTTVADSFTSNHATFQRTLDDMERLSLGTVSDADLEHMRRAGREIAAAVTARPPDEAQLEAQFQRFDPLRERARKITREGNSFIDSEIANLRTTSREARWFLLFCVFALIPSVLVLVGLLTRVISRPIHEIQLAIRRLGEGDFNQPVVVSAPSGELDAVGTQLDWMRRRLAELESEKNQFLRQMSHELKTPLASIREGVELLRDGALGALSDKQTEVVNILQENSLELLALIENLLNFAAWQQQRSQLNFSHVALQELIDDLLNRHRLSIRQKRLALATELAPIRIDADRDQIRLLLDNLITNALKFSPPRGRLAIRLYREENFAILRVADDGPGVPEEDAEQIFNPFYQARRPERAHVQGTGIGLSVAREVVRAHHGTIGLITSTETRGACFQVRLPCSSEEA